ncbi:MAG: sugar kinase [bacterium]|nr:sugar kinase [bacterium]
MMTYDVVTFGEAMVRLSSPDYRRLEQTPTLDVSAGGAELNVAASVARLGLASAWVSRLPTNPLGRMIANKGREFGVDVGHVIWVDDERAGLYFIEHGAAPRATQVIYDRKESAFAGIRPGMVDWGALLSRARLLHVGGITPALSASAAQTQREAMIAARAAGCLVSYDLNYRAALWSLEEARAAQLPLMEFVDILVTSLPDQPEVTELISGESGADPAGVARRLAERFGFRAALVTMRGTPSVWRTTWTSLAWVAGEVFTDRRYEIEAVDRIGGGDACVAGFLVGYLEGDPGRGVRLGNAMSALKQTSPTDWPWPTRSEAEALIADGGTRLVR